MPVAANQRWTIATATVLAVVAVLSSSVTGVCGLPLRRLTCPISKKGYHEYRVAGYELLALRRNVEARRCFEEAMMLYMTRIGQYHSNVRPSDVAPEAMAKAHALTRSVQQSMGLINTIQTTSDPNANGKRIGPAQYPGAGGEFDTIAEADARAERERVAKAGGGKPVGPSPIEGLAPHQMPVPLNVDITQPKRDAMGDAIARLREARIASDNRAALLAKQRAANGAAGAGGAIGAADSARKEADDILMNRFWDDHTIRARVSDTYDQQLAEQRKQFNE